MTFDSLLQVCNATHYPEQSDPMIELFSENGVAWLTGKLKPNGRVLDIGIGNGFALRQIARRGFVPYGISVSQTEVNSAVEAGFSAELLDMHAIGPKMGAFDGVFARHVLEHSPCPLLVLNNIREVLVDDGWLFIEVPAPETTAHHEFNPNHYSVLSMAGWAALLRKARFEPLEGGMQPIAANCGPDTYFVILAQKK